MKQYNVDKFLNKRPRIMGLNVPLFFAFVGIVVICSILLFSYLSITMFVFTTVFLLVVYLAFLFIGRINIFRILFSEKFPDIVVNDNF